MDRPGELRSSLGLGDKAVAAMLAGLFEHLEPDEIAALLLEKAGEDKAQEVALAITQGRKSRGLVAVQPVHYLRQRQRPGQEWELPLLRYMLTIGQPATLFLSELGEHARGLLAHTYEEVAELSKFAPEAKFVPGRWQDDDTQLRIIFERIGWACIITNGFLVQTEEWSGNLSERGDGRTTSGQYLQADIQARILRNHPEILEKLSDEEIAALNETPRLSSFIRKRHPNDKPAKSRRKGKAVDGPRRDALLHFVMELSAELIQRQRRGAKRPR
jgi:hypothetical protein